MSTEWPALYGDGGSLVGGERPNMLDLALNGLAGSEKRAGLDGIAVKSLLGGAVLRGQDPLSLLRHAGIDPAVYGKAEGAIDGRELFRLVRQAQVALDDSFFGFFAERFRLALELERTLTYPHCERPDAPLHCRH